MIGGGVSRIGWDDFFELMTRHRLKVQPVCERKRKKIVVLWWVASRVSVVPKSTQNYIKDGDSAKGATPEEAVERLATKLKLGLLG